MICPECRAENLEGSESCFICGASFGAAPRRSIRKGTLIAGRYEIVQALGRGGMGTVYRAHDQALDETVAVKLLRSEVAQSPEMARRFRSEIKLARRVTHKGVCRIHEYGVDGELYFISMEFVDGVDLKRVMRERGALDPAFALRLSIQVCDGLQAIHDVGIVHRDLKTANLMLDRSNLVKLMDFGIAKQTGVTAEGLSGATHTGQIIGTPEYMSPEQARGDKVDARSDVYALGIVLFELFTGDVPFRADTPIATILKHLGEPPPLRAAAGRALPEPIVPILERALAKAPQDRFPSVVEMASALRAVRLEGPVLSAIPRFEATRDATARQPAPATPVPQRPLPMARTPVPARTPIPGTPAPLGRGRVRDTGPALPTSSELLRLLPWAAVAFAVVGFTAGAALYLWKQWPPSPTLAPTASASAPAAASSVEPSPRPTVLVSTSPLPATVALASPPPPKPTQPPPTRAPETPVPTPRPVATPTPAPATPRPLQWVTPVPVASASPEPTASATAQRVREGLLQLLVVPWAEVFVEQRSLGTTPIKPVSLPEGSYAVRFVHPDYHPLQKQVTIRAGETVKLEVDLKQEGFPKVQE